MARASMRPPRPASGYHSATVIPYLFLSHFFLHPLSAILLPSDRVPPPAYKKHPSPFPFRSSFSCEETTIRILPLHSSSLFRVMFGLSLLSGRERGGCASIQPGNREEFIRSNWKLNWMYYNEWNNRRGTERFEIRVNHYRSSRIDSRLINASGGKWLFSVRFAKFPYFIGSIVPSILEISRTVQPLFSFVVRKFRVPFFKNANRLG